MKALEQGSVIAKDLELNGVKVSPDSEMVAIIAYLQKLGKYEIPATPPEPPSGIPNPFLPTNPDKTRPAQASAKP
jgi:cytochrome c oxidase cbb3-type subunit I/II